MGLKTTAKDTDTVAWVSCNDCKAEATRTQSQDKTRAKKRAERLAEEAGFVWYDGGKTWVCPACRIRRLPDKMKAECPKLCEQYGIPTEAEAGPACRQAAAGDRRDEGTATVGKRREAEDGREAGHPRPRSRILAARRFQPRRGPYTLARRFALPYNIGSRPAVASHRTFALYGGG